jgi:nicotinamidase-related amidase
VVRPAGGRATVAALTHRSADMADLKLDAAAHLAIDMQRLFAEPDSPWCVPWMGRVVPQVLELARRHVERTVFTRFLPPERAEDMPGAWRDYYRHWRAMTQQNLDERLLELVPPLQALVPPAHLCDKAVYSGFANPRLASWLKSQGVDTLIVSGGETDVCVLATVMSAIDLGYHVVLATDALCSTRDQTHDALLLLYRERYSQQITTATTDQVLKAWN